jgi:hypothetical protein
MRLGRSLTAAVIALAAARATLSGGVGSGAASSPRLALIDRHISQHHSRWLVRYQLRHLGSETLVLSASDVQVRYEAALVNSSCRPHAVPHDCQAQWTLSQASQMLATVIDSANERQRCRERITVALSAGPEPFDELPATKTAFLPIELAPGQVFWLYFLFEHDHFLFGSYDPLLGRRQLELTLGPVRFRDLIELNTERNPARPAVKLSAPASERLDVRLYRSPPDSLYLAADVPGYQYFRFDDLPIRYGTRFRVSFWYLVARGSEGTCHARIMEYQDTPSAWHRLEGGFDELMTGQGHWQRFERVFQSRDDATTVALDFRIVGANMGELWIDDVKVEPLYAESGRP